MSPRTVRRVITVSNRLPVVASKRDSGEWDFHHGSGGLVTALVPVLRDRGGVWIGWSGLLGDEDKGLDEALAAVRPNAGYDLCPVHLTQFERDNFYFGFSNEILWPVFHDLLSLSNFDPVYWASYRAVNRKFARVVASRASTDDFVWVHDYQLIGVAAALRELGLTSRAGFFLHIPFPPLDMFLVIPWREEILRQLLQYDFVGFQTFRDQRNFLGCVRRLVPSAKIVSRGRVSSVLFGERRVRVGYFPIGIDFNQFSSDAGSKEVAESAWYLHEAHPERTLLLGLDRLDYTKGIPYRLRSFELALDRYPHLRGRITLQQVVVPSREDIPEYGRLKTEIEQVVGRINGRFSSQSWIPVHYIYRHLEQTELLAAYRASEIALITPLKDGMNLVCKEYCACNLEERGVLILSEFAGAADQLQGGALLVNPYDTEKVAEAINRAFKMPVDERQKRMKCQRDVVREQDIFWWVDACLRAAVSRDLSYFPRLEDYRPIINPV